MTSTRADVVVIGAGAIGASVALHLAQAGRAVLVLEKEDAPARHQSSRNSGVVHAGYNVKPGTAKARYCVEGNRRLRAYCEEKRVPLAPGGILVVARDERERHVLTELDRRAKANGVDAKLLDAAALREQEPHATGIEALHARDAMSFDAAAYVRTLATDAEAAGARFRYGVRVHRIDETSDGVTLATDAGPLRARAVVNAAGLFADVLAAHLAPDMRVIPFRGHYAELRAERRHLVRSHVYGAPDLAFPFLGAHLSRRTDGRVLVGPGAMLAFGREAYHLTSLAGGGLARTLTFGGFWRMMARPEFRRLVRSEVAKSLFLRAIWKEARHLVPALQPGDLVRSFSGNRAQQVMRDGKLVEDIVVRTTLRAVHVLNAVSPGLTCSLPFGEHLARQVEALPGLSP